MYVVGFRLSYSFNATFVQLYFNEVAVIAVINKTLLEIQITATLVMVINHNMGTIVNSTVLIWWI